jgi:prepilin-type N-terminal cleavage/methylation domain-containing protein
MVQPTPATARKNGFTLVEVMMAATILVVGFIGLIQAVTVSSAMMDTARRQTLASEIINHEIEKLRLVPWSVVTGTDIVGLPAGPTSVAIDAQFNAAIAASGAAFSLSRSVADPVANLREVTFTVTWVVTTSRRSGGSLLTFTYTRKNSAYFSKYGLNLTYQRS